MELQDIWQFTCPDAQQRSRWLCAFKAALSTILRSSSEVCVQIRSLVFESRRSEKTAHNGFTTPQNDGEVEIMQRILVDTDVLIDAGRAVEVAIVQLEVAAENLNS